ncbi:hypothetical protein K435DRAFT_798932 [Dendrothele bispora CBS 962.96]|uniref:Uncharacterized protein n=1 Tax=Dendrothele bispora (strain CBS 962.96) TaxID=1314807 RepID=A0A4S8LXM6_DENBC|nr:hypothetical protein K435DRAFT_798932 [Dendrothele bispora CBS 962.96]
MSKPYSLFIVNNLPSTFFTLLYGIELCDRIRENSITDNYSHYHCRGQTHLILPHHAVFSVLPTPFQALKLSRYHSKALQLYLPSAAPFPTDPGTKLSTQYSVNHQSIHCGLVRSSNEPSYNAESF